MSRTSSDEQLNFLLKCVKHSNNGKVSTCTPPLCLGSSLKQRLILAQVDFQSVAEECGIVSKGAA